MIATKIESGTAHILTRLDEGGLPLTLNRPNPFSPGDEAVL